MRAGNGKLLTIIQINTYLKSKLDLELEWNVRRVYLIYSDVLYRETKLNLNYIFTPSIFIAF